MNDIGKDFIENHKKFITEYITHIRIEEDLLSGLELLVKRSEDAIYSDNVSIQGLVMKIFKNAVSQGGALENFLSTKPIMPHEAKENHLVVFAEIITCLLTNSLQHGKTNRGGVDQIGFISQRESVKVWSEIQIELMKICTEFFDITPFLDTKKENFPEIGFFMNSKWKNQHESIK